MEENHHRNGPYFGPAGTPYPLEDPSLSNYHPYFPSVPTQPPPPHYGSVSPIQEQYAQNHPQYHSQAPLPQTVNPPRISPIDNDSVTRYYQYPAAYMQHGRNRPISKPLLLSERGYNALKNIKAMTGEQSIAAKRDEVATSLRNSPWFQQNKLEPLRDDDLYAEKYNLLGSSLFSGLYSYEEGRYYCRYQHGPAPCNYSAKGPNSIARHIRKSMGYTPYTCDTDYPYHSHCSKRFSTGDQYTSHLDYYEKKHEN